MHCLALEVATCCWYFRISCFVLQQIRTKYWNNVGASTISHRSSPTCATSRRGDEDRVLSVFRQGRDRQSDLRRQADILLNNHTRGEEPVEPARSRHADSSYEHLRCFLANEECRVKKILAPSLSLMPLLPSSIVQSRGNSTPQAKTSQNKFHYPSIFPTVVIVGKLQQSLRKKQIQRY